VDKDAMAAGTARRPDHRPGPDARRPSAGPVRPTLHRPALRLWPAHVPRRLRTCAAGRDDNRHYYLLGSVGRKAPALAGASLRILQKRPPAMCRARRWSPPSTTRPPSGAGRSSRVPVAGAVGRGAAAMARLQAIPGQNGQGRPPSWPRGERKRAEAAQEGQWTPRPTGFYADRPRLAWIRVRDRPGGGTPASTPPADNMRSLNSNIGHGRGECEISP
jgi:hypothetical protein